MDEAAPLLDAARTMTLTRFVERHRGVYLVKRPVVDTVRPPEGDRQKPSFDTQPIGTQTISMMKVPLEFLAELLGEWAHRWLVLELKKRTETFPDRISLGRTTHCDVVLRFPFVSKLHAHLFVDDDGTVEIVDRSTNGIRIDDEPITKDVRVRVELGQILSFGPLELELHDAEGLYYAMREGQSEH